VGAPLVSALPRDTIIYGRASPGTSNIVAWHLARLSGRPFVAHFSDEWPGFQLRANGRRWLAAYKWPLFQRWRRRILRDAGALTFTNPAQARKQLGADWSTYGRKAFVATHVSSPRTRPARPPQYDRFHVVHTGNFYPPNHTAAALVQGIRIFLDRTPEARAAFRFTQAGWSHGDLPAWVARCGLGDQVEVMGRLMPDEVLALLDAASLLIGVDYARPGSTTILSKLPDYLQAGRPVLAITSPSAAMYRLFHHDGAGLTANYASPEEVAARLGEVFVAWRQGRLESLLPTPASRDAFSPDRILSELASAFCASRQPLVGVQEVAAT
jgi:hypothetical protein